MELTIEDVTAIMNLKLTADGRLSSQLENLYQKISADAMADNPIQELMNQEFDNLCQEIEADAIADYTDLEPRNQELDLLAQTPLKGCTTAHTGRTEALSTCEKVTPMNDQEVSRQTSSRKRKDNSFSDTDMERPSVKSIRRLFESNVVSSESHATSPVNKLQRVVSVQDKRRFWESYSRSRDAATPQNNDSSERTGLKSIANTETDTTSPLIPLASPEPSLPDSGRNSPKSIPENAKDSFKATDLAPEESDPSSSYTLKSRVGLMLGINPEKAEAVGTGLHHGLVGVKNKFVVNVRGAGTSFLTVGVHGAGGTAQTITQKALDKWTYEVTYTVRTPGYYILFVRWGDCYIRKSPFVCHVSDPSAIP